MTGSAVGIIYLQLSQHRSFNAAFINQVASMWESHSQHTVAILYLVEVYVRRASLTMDQVMKHIQLIQLGRIPELPDEWTLHENRANNLQLPASLLDGLDAFKQVKLCFPACADILHKYKRGQYHQLVRRGSLYSEIFAPNQQ